MLLSRQGYIQRTIQPVQTIGNIKLLKRHAIVPEKRKRYLEAIES
jgi:hypothetical protein